MTTLTIDSSRPQRPESTPRFAESCAGAEVIAEQGHRTRLRAAKYGIAIVSFIAATHIFILSAGGLVPWPQYSAYYDLQADAFMRGQVSLIQKPDSRLLALKDPYDPGANLKLRLHDASLYHGKYYLYWGPVPSLLIVPVKYLLHLLGYNASVGDQFIVLAFSLGLTSVVGALTLRVRSRWFSNAPPWTVVLPIAVAGLGTPLMFLMARAAMYEGAIIAGQFFLLSGFLIALDGFFPQTGSNSGERRSVGPTIGRLILVGLCWDLALGSRPSLLFAVAALAALSTWRLLRTDSPRIRRLVQVGILGLTLAMGGAAYGLFNYVRFDSPTEFGQRYQLCGRNIHQVAAAGELFCGANAIPGLWSYFFRPVFPLSHFPFLLARTGDGTFPSFIHRPQNYETQDDIAGVLIVVPFLWLTLIPLGRFLRRRRGINEVGATPAQPADLNWLVLCLLGAAVLGFGPILFMCGSTMRYLVDLTPPLVILAAIGLWLRLNDLGERRGARWRFLTLAVSLTVFSAGVGVLLSFTGYYSHIERNNPSLFYALGGVPSAHEFDAGPQGMRVVAAFDPRNGEPTHSIPWAEWLKMSNAGKVTPADNTAHASGR